MSWIALHNLQQDKPDVASSVVAVGVEFNGKSTMSVGTAINYDNVDASTPSPSSASEPFSSSGPEPFSCGWHPAPHIISSIDRLSFSPPKPLDVFVHPAWFAIVFEQPPATQTLLPPGDALPLLDEAAARTQRFSEHLLYPKMPSSVPKWPLIQFNSWGYGTDINEDNMLRALAVAKQLGLEAFVLDFGWQDTLDDGTPCLGCHPPPNPPQPPPPLTSHRAQLAARTPPVTLLRRQLDGRCEEVSQWPETSCSRRSQCTPSCVVPA